MNIEFAGQSVLVAGAARGIGRGIVEAFAARGASVFAGDRLRDEMAGLPAHQTQLDLLDKAQVRAWIAESAAASGHSPDVLVYVAGGVLGQSATPLEDVDEAAWRAVLDVNLTGAFLAAQAVTPGMKQAGRGRIVFIASAPPSPASRPMPRPRLARSGWPASSARNSGRSESRSTRSRRASSAPVPITSGNGSPIPRSGRTA